MYLMLH